MATRYINTDSSGGDGTTNATSGGTAAYASASSWESNETALTEAHTVYASCPSGTADSKFTIDGLSDGTYQCDFIGDSNPLIYNNSDEYHIQYTPAASYQNILYVNDPNVKVTGVQIHMGAEGVYTGLAGATLGVAAGIILESCGMYNTTGTRFTDTENHGIVLTYGDADRKIGNCVTVGFYDGIKCAHSAGIEASTNYIYSNTFHNNAVGLATSWDDARTRNNVCAGNGTDITYNGGWHDYNLSEDTTANKTNDVSSASITFTSTTTGSWDFHLANDTTDAAGAGADLDADTYYPITIDADGDTRHATAPDMGADEFTSSGYTLTADGGSYAGTGTAASLLKDSKVTADAGSYTGAGTAASLLKGSLLTAESGSYAYTGQDATLTYTPIGGYTLTADAGSYAESGTAAALLYGRRLNAETSSYALSGQDSNLLYGRRLVADVGSYAESGTAANLLYKRVLSAESGAYTYSGLSANLLYSGSVAVIVPGLEYSLPENLNHYSLKENKLHYSMPED